MDQSSILDLLPALPALSIDPVTAAPVITIAQSTSGPAGEMSVRWSNPPTEAMAIQIEIRKKQ